MSTDGRLIVVERVHDIDGRIRLSEIIEVDTAPVVPVSDTSLSAFNNRLSDDGRYVLFGHS